MDRARDELMFGIRRSVRYHLRRRAYFEFMDRLSSFFLILLGSSAMAGIAPYKWIGFLVAVVSSLKLIFAPGLRAGVHAQFVKDFTRLEQELSRDDTEETFSKAKAMRLDLESTEPPILRVLDAICHNELARAQGITDPNEYVHLSSLQRLMAHLFSWREHTLKKGDPTGARIWS